MATLNLAGIAEVLKTVYLGGLQFQGNEKASAFLAQLERKTEDFNGDKIQIAFRWGTQGGFGNRADDADLPVATSRKTKKAEWTVKNLFHTIALTHRVIEAGKSNVGSFARILEQEMQDAETDMKLNLSRQVISDSSGLLATITAINAGTKELTIDTAMYMIDGQMVDVFDVSNGAAYAVENKEITKVKRKENKVTISDVTGVQVGDTLYIHGNKADELHGLKSVFDDTTLYGLTRADYPFLSATELANVGEISDMDIQQALDDAEIDVGASPGFAMTSHGVRRAYINYLRANKSTVNTLELKGGWKGLDYNGIPLVADKFIKPGELYFLDMNDWGLYTLGDFGFMDMGEGVLKPIANKAAYGATLYRYCDIACTKPKAQVRLSGITEHGAA